MTDQTLFDMGVGVEGDDFPWPIGTDEQPGMSSAYGLAMAQSWPGLTPAERGMALFVGDGCGGPGLLPRLALYLDIPVVEARKLLWGLLEKGYLQAVAGWWTR